MAKINQLKTTAKNNRLRTMNSMSEMWRINNCPRRTLPSRVNQCSPRLIRLPHVRINTVMRSYLENWRHTVSIIENSQLKASGEKGGKSRSCGCDARYLSGGSGQWIGRQTRDGCLCVHKASRGPFGQSLKGMIPIFMKNFSVHWQHLCVSAIMLWADSSVRKFELEGCERKDHCRRARWGWSYTIFEHQSCSLRWSDRNALIRTSYYQGVAKFIAETDNPVQNILPMIRPSIYPLQWKWRSQDYENT